MKYLITLLLLVGCTSPQVVVKNAEEIFAGRSYTFSQHGIYLSEPLFLRLVDDGLLTEGEIMNKK